jgi:prepilin-type N-terminal cleavage/methylation domain-containing protein
MKTSSHRFGFTLIELLVSLTIIGLLTAILYANFEQARSQARDKSRLAALKELQLAVEQYRAQVGSYPLGDFTNCGTVASPATTADFVGPGDATLSGFKACRALGTNNYINGLSPSYIVRLPFDPKFEFVSDKGFYYRSDGVSYKLMLYDVAESILVTSFADEFARCPSAMGACGSGVPATTYAVYSLGAEGW